MRSTRGGGRWLVALIVGLLVSSGVPGVAAPENVPVTEAVPSTDAFEQPTLARDPSDPQHLALSYQRRPPTTCLLAQSFDGGVSWSRIAVAGKDARFPFPDGFSSCAYTGVAFDADGTLTYVYSMWKGFYEEARTFVTVSDDGGSTFSTPELVSEPPADPVTSYSDFWPSVATSPAGDRLYVAWARFTCPVVTCLIDVVVARSTDGGRSFSEPTRIDALPNTGRGYPSIATGPDGTVYVSWADPPDQWASFVPCFLGLLTGGRTPSTEDLILPRTIYVSSSTDGGESFGSPVSVARARKADGCTPPPFSGPYPVAAGPEGSVLVAWDEPVGDTVELRVARSVDAGGSWGEPVAVAEGVGASRDLRNPWLSATAGGRVDLAFYGIDAEEGLRDVYLSPSADGGGSFAPAERITDEPSDPDIPPVAGVPPLRPVFVLTDAEGSSLAWMDSRRGTPETGHADIYFGPAS